MIGLHQKTQIIGHNKPCGDPIMPASRFRKRQGFPNIPSIPLTQGSVPTLHRGGFSGLFADTAVRFHRKHRDIRLPEIAEAQTSPRGRRNPMPEPTTGPFTVIATDKGEHVSRPTAQHGPQPAFPPPLADERPDLIHFQAVIWPGGLERRAQGRQAPDCFLIPSARVWRERWKIRQIPRRLGRS